jgi:DNA polymerase I
MASEHRDDLILVDGSGYIFRAFFALPQLNNSRGMPTNAVYGFIRMLLKLLKDERPTHIAVVFDSPKRTFRDDLFAEYKANRTEAPGDLRVQIPFVHRAVEAFRIKSIVKEGYEADDVIGTLAMRAAKARFNTTIITADKDFMQLVGPHVTLWDTMKERRIGPRDVKDRFGVEPPALIEIAALTGDQIDNVKGVPGVGEKTAAALIQKFGSIKELYAHLDRIEESGIRAAKRVAGLLTEHRADVELARKLVKIETDMPLDVAPEELQWPGIDEPAVAELLRELEFTSLMQEIAPSQAQLPMSTSTEVVLAAGKTADALKKAAAAERIGFDLEADASGAERLQIFADDQTYVLGPTQIRDAAALLAAEKPPKVCHDLKAHLTRLARHGVKLAGVDFDTMLAGYIINSGRTEPPIIDLYHEHLAPLGTRALPGTNAEVVAKLQPVMTAKLEADGLMSLFRDIEMPIASILAEMEQTGILVDREALATISREFDEEVRRLERECYDLAGKEFNLNSPIQLRDILFDHLKLATKGLKKTKSGYSTDADTLEKLAGVHPMPKKLIEYRVIAKLKSTYADALTGLIDPRDGRVHTTFHQALAATGRVSSSDPNLQNIPTRSVEGRRIRRAFIAAKGSRLLSVDYSQIDLRVLAHLSGDPTLVSAFQSGEDIHARTASELLGMKPGQVDADARRIAKTINFGIIYGMGPQRLAAQLGIALSDASDYIKRYFERLPGIRTFMDETVRKARETGYVTTMYGRRRYVPEINSGPGGSRAQAERIAINTPIQGSAADLIKVAMIRVDHEFKQRKLSARMLLQVHDELLIEVAEKELEQAAEIAKREMEGVAEMKVPLAADVKAGLNWAEMDPRR